MPFEILNRAFVFLRRSLAVERAEIFSFSRSQIFVGGIQPILTGFQFPDHKKKYLARRGEVVRFQFLWRKLRRLRHIQRDGMMG